MRRRTRKREAWWLLAACLALGCGGESARSGVQASSGPAALRLVDEIGQPLPRTALLVDGAIVTTDEFGRATTDPLPAKYDVAVVVGSNAYAAIGLTTRSPLLELPDIASPELTSYATINVEDPPDLSAYDRVVLIAGVTDLAADQQVVSLDSLQVDPYVQATWPGNAERTLSAEAVVADLDDAEFSVVGYSGYAARSFQLSPDDQVTWHPTFLPVPFATAAIHVDSDAVALVRPVIYGSQVHEAAGPSGGLTFAMGTPSADLMVLDLPDARYTVTAQSYYDTGVFVAAQDDVEVGASVTFQAAPPPELLAPEDGASIALATEFRWIVMEGAVYRLIAYTDDGEDPFVQYEVVTAEASAKLPDLSALGLASLRGRMLAWTVHAEYGPTSVDEDVAGTPLSGWGVAYSRLATESP